MTRAALAAAQVPAVCAAAGGLVNLVRDGESGLLFAPGNVADFADKVRRLVADGELRRQMGAAAREEALRWDWRAATSVLRNYQYTLAEMRHRARQERRRRRSGWRGIFCGLGRCRAEATVEPEQTVHSSTA